MKLTGARYTSQACGVREEMEEGGCPIDEEQQLKEALNRCEAVEERWEPGDGKRLGRVTEACAEGDMLSTVPGTVQTTCVDAAGNSVPVSSCGTVEKSKPPLAAPASPAGPCCPEGWIGYRGKCYYFSETEGNWTYSQSQCSSLNASLAGIDSEQEKDFLLRYKNFFDRWIGLQKEPGQPWRWPNGTEFDLRFPIRGGGDSDCAVLGEDAVSSLRCSIERNWIGCKLDAHTKGLETKGDSRV
ncbi:C-type lectin domain family 2 member D-like [Emydura macquarii macquarii]|uniref:C-type lectin domain family 2 member D-like n=1 Tax=Emydura macquarii macquarii TaxID=1129001 RepID=UPI00352AD62C